MELALAFVFIPCAVLAIWLVTRNERESTATPADTMLLTRELSSSRHLESDAATSPWRPPVDVAQIAPEEPGREGALFAYAGIGNPWRGDFAVVDVETTGFSPAKGDRVIEIAVARVDASGNIREEYATLLNPDGRSTGPVWVHGIEDEHVADAPRFEDVVGKILTILDGAVLVAHNAEFEEKFLHEEFRRANVRLPKIPALCTLWLSRKTLSTPNHKLATIAEHFGIDMPDAHVALGDVRAVARLLPKLLDRSGDVRIPIAPPAFPMVQVSTGARERTRAVALRAGEKGWMDTLLRRLPLRGADVDGASETEYLDALARALQDGRIVKAEIESLAEIAGRGGFGAAQVRALNQRFLESLREAALADGVMAKSEVKDLQRAAAALAEPGYFDDLVAETSTAAVASGPSGRSETKPRAAATRRCGHCREPGHNRTTCPGLADMGSPLHQQSTPSPG